MLNYVLCMPRCHIVTEWLSTCDTSSPSSHNNRGPLYGVIFFYERVWWSGLAVQPTSLSRSSSSPKVPTFDGTNTAQFRPWIIQFEAIARHQGWTAGERVVRLVSSLTGPAANLLIGMTLGQLDNYNFLRTRLSRRYDPPEREEAHRAELRARTRRRNESADEFAENINAHTHWQNRTC